MKAFKLAFNVIKVLLALLPVIRVLVKAFEVPGFGPEKKKAVLDSLVKIIDALPWTVADEVKATVLNIVSGVIDLIVGVLNLIGHDWGESE